MASRTTRPAPQASSNRQNEYFVPRDGIDREVISADICRYLGNDALVRPGMYENPQNGQVTHGYYITAYRNLTTAMIEDLKADSARWENERRAQNSRHSSGVSYHQSETHQSRQHFGPTENTHQPDPYGARPERPYGSGSATGYPSATAGYQPGPSQAQAHGYSGASYSGYQQSGQVPTPDNRYASPGGNPMMPPPQPTYQDPYVATGANNKTSRAYTPNSNDPYAARSSAAPQPSSYATSGQVQPGYPGASGYSYSQVPTSAAPGFASTMHPQDPFMGRGGQASQQQPQAYSTQPTQQAQYTQAQAQQSSHSSERHRSSRR